jgi:hypothetical protein
VAGNVTSDDREVVLGSHGIDSTKKRKKSGRAGALTIDDGGVALVINEEDERGVRSERTERSDHEVNSE